MLTRASKSPGHYIMLFIYLLPPPPSHSASYNIASNHHYHHHHHSTSCNACIQYMRQCSKQKNDHQCKLLCTRPSTSTLQRVRSCITTCPLCGLWSTLEQPITATEVVGAKKLLQNGHAPGPNVISNELS